MVPGLGPKECQVSGRRRRRRCCVMRRDLRRRQRIVVEGHLRQTAGEARAVASWVVRKRDIVLAAVVSSGLSRRALTDLLAVDVQGDRARGTHSREVVPGSVVVRGWARADAVAGRRVCVDTGTYCAVGLHADVVAEGMRPHEKTVIPAKVIRA